MFFNTVKVKFLKSTWAYHLFTKQLHSKRINLPFGHAALQYRLGLRIWKNGGSEQKVIPIILCAGFLNDLRHINRYAKPCLL